MATPAEVVAETFSNAESLANTALTKADTYLDALADAVVTPPSMSVTWAAPDEPTAIAYPDRPTGLDDISATEWNTAVDDAMPTAFAEDAPVVVIDDFAEVVDEPVFPDAPTVSFDAVPTVPEVGDVDVPAVPTVDLPDAPNYLSLSTPTFAGVDLHEDWLTRLEDIPELDLVAPTPYSYARGADYASALLTALKEKIATRLEGGTGLDPAVEAAIWDRARSRESKVAQANIDQVSRLSESLGYQLPSGYVAQQIRKAEQDYNDKMSSLSRDIAIKQAELEQDNLKTTIQQGMELEGKLIDYALQLERIAFEAAREYATNALAVYNARVEAFKATLSSYQVYAEAYKTLIQGELAKVDVFKALIQAEQAKADFNKTLIEQYKAEVDARLTTVRLYEAQLGGAKALMELEGLKISASGERVKAYIATVNAKTAEVELYKSQVATEIERTYGIYKTKAQVFQTVSNAQAEKAKAELAAYTAKINAKDSEYKAWGTRVEAEKSRIQAVQSLSGILLDSYKADISKAQAEVEQDVRRWEVNIKEYEAQQNYILTSWKMNTDVTMSLNQARLDAAKTGAQIYAQLTASGYGMIHAQAQVSASGGTSVQYSYSGETNASVSPITSI